MQGQELKPTAPDRSDVRTRSDGAGGSLHARTRTPVPRATGPARKAARLCALSLALGCSTISIQAGEVREALLGSGTRAVSACLGNAPFLEIQDDGAELWGYALPLQSGRPADIEITRSVGPATAFQRPRVQAGDPTERRGIQDEFADRRIGPGQCLYLFEVRDGVVAALDARGRTPTNLNADAQCTAQLRRCLPESAAR